MAGCTGGIPPVSCRQTTDVERERSGTLSQVDTGISSILEIIAGTDLEST